MSFAHFDAELRPEPDVRILVYFIHIVIEHLLELLQVTRA